MRIAVMSDSHDHLDNLKAAFDIIHREKAERIIHCGDFVAPFVFKAIAAEGIPAHAVFGNNDGDQYLLTKAALNSNGLLDLSALIGEVDADGFRIAYTHQWAVAEGLVATGKYHMVCYGHDHTFYKDDAGGTLVLNPGEIMGKDGSPGFCLVDTQSGEVRRIALD
ncbi:MAG: YfcE family phosphodiesterase [Thermodesulfobacteriota bacterium]